MQAAWIGKDEAGARRAADQHVRDRSELYPTLAAHGAPVGNDWDDIFVRGLGYLLDGIQQEVGGGRAGRGFG